MVVGEIGTGAPHLLFYGHYDVQPVDPLDLWERPPFDPAVEETAAGEVIRGRGTSDDKGQVMTFLEALRAWVGVHGRAPCRITVFLEGEEESGSPSLVPFLEAQRDRLGAADIALICDTPPPPPPPPPRLHPPGALGGGGDPGPGRPLPAALRRPAPPRRAPRGPPRGLSGPPPPPARGGAAVAPPSPGGAPQNRRRPSRRLGPPPERRLARGGGAGPAPGARRGAPTFCVSARARPAGER